MGQGRAGTSIIFISGLSFAGAEDMAGGGLVTVTFPKQNEDQSPVRSLPSYGLLLGAEWGGKKNIGPPPKEFPD